MKRLVAGVSLVITLFTAPTLGAQSPVPGSTIRLTTAKGAYTGRLMGAGPGGVIIAAPDSMLRFSPREIDRVELRGTEAARYAKILGYTGAGAGALIGLAEAGDLCAGASDCGGMGVSVVAAGTLLFGAIGTLTGALIGSTLEKWTPVDVTTLRGTIFVRVTR